MIKIAPSRSQTTGRAHNSAPNPGSAGVPGCVNVVAGVLDMMDAKAVHCLLKLLGLTTRWLFRLGWLIRGAAASNSSTIPGQLGDGKLDECPILKKNQFFQNRPATSLSVCFSASILRRCEMINKAIKLFDSFDHQDAENRCHGYQKSRGLSTTRHPPQKARKQSAISVSQSQSLTASRNCVHCTDLFVQPLRSRRVRHPQQKIAARCFTGATAETVLHALLDHGCQR